MATARAEPLNRHELMRRAMATAQEYGEHDGDDSGSVFEDDQFSNSHHSHNAHTNQQPHPANSTPSQQDRLSGPAMLRSARHGSLSSTLW